jgi:hypothetical protein
MARHLAYWRHTGVAGSACRICAPRLAEDATAIAIGCDGMQSLYNLLPWSSSTAPVILEGDVVTVPVDGLVA